MKRLRNTLCRIGAITMVAVLFGAPMRAGNSLDPSLPTAVRFARSEALRHPSYKTIDFNTQLKWNYTHGLLCQAIFAAYDYYHSDSIDCADLYTYAKGYYETTISAEGSIYKYKKSEYSLDKINAGKNLFRLYNDTKDERYRIAMETLRDQLKDHPRTSDGGYWHKQNYPYQMWLDGLYMGAPFYARYARDHESDPSASYADVIKQFVLAASHTYDERSGLYIHGWDEKRVQNWADPETGKSQHVWGRALGWYAMALVDVLEILPETTPDRDTLLTILRGIFDVLPRYQDPENGAWYQVTNYPDSINNYPEMSSTAMFAYTIVKGVRLGYLDKELLPVAHKAYDGMVKEYLVTESDGKLSLKNICAVAGLSSDRDGSYEYYTTGTSVRKNDPKGVGPFILLCIELDKLDNPKPDESTPPPTDNEGETPDQGGDNGESGGEEDKPSEPEVPVTPEGIAFLYDKTYSTTYTPAIDPFVALLDSFGLNVDTLDIELNAAPDIDHLARYDLVIISEAMKGGRPYTNGLLKLVGKTSVINMKVFNYTTGRWNWGTPLNPDKGTHRLTVTEAGKSHPLFHNITPDNDGKVTIFSASDPQNHMIQVWHSPTTATADDAILATAGGHNAIHTQETADSIRYALLPFGNDPIAKATSGITTEAKQLFTNAIAWTLGIENPCDFGNKILPDEGETPDSGDNDENQGGNPSGINVPTEKFSSAQITDSGNTLYITYRLQVPGEVAISLISMRGTPLLHATETHCAGTHTLRLDTSTLPAGLYIIEIKNNEENTIQKYIKK